MRTFTEEQIPSVNFEKEAGGASWRIYIGMPGSAGYLSVGDLSSSQQKGLRAIIRLSLFDAVHNTQRSMRVALGIESR